MIAPFGGQHRRRAFVAVKTPYCQHLRLDRLLQRLQCHGARVHLVGHRGQTETDGLARVALVQAIQGLVWPYFSKTIVSSGHHLITLRRFRAKPVLGPASQSIDGFQIVERRVDSVMTN